MTKRERKEVISILSDLQSKIQTRKHSSAANRKAAMSRMDNNPSSIEDGWLRRWERLVVANDAVDAMLAKLIEEQRQCLKMDRNERSVKLFS